MFSHEDFFLAQLNLSGASFRRSARLTQNETAPPTGVPSVTAPRPRPPPGHAVPRDQHQTAAVGVAALLAAARHAAAHALLPSASGGYVHRGIQRHGELWPSLSKKKYPQIVCYISSNKFSIFVSECYSVLNNGFSSFNSLVLVLLCMLPTTLPSRSATQ